MSRPLAVTAVIVAFGSFGGCGFGGDDPPEPAAALTPPESSWLPGQRALGAYPEFADVLGRAVELAKRRLKERELQLERLERQKLAARKRASDEARRRYLEAKRRAERAYKRALEEAARERREQELKRKEALEKLAAARRKREEALRVDPGEECKFGNVRRRFRCERGRLPDPATDGQGGGE
jgi:hypothetical protein